MKIKLKNNETIDFILSNSAKCWMGSGIINSTKVDFEIYEERYIQSNIDWGYFQDFIFYLEENDILPELIKKSQILLLALADTIGYSIGENENISDFEMQFVGLSFQGKSISSFTNGYSYSLWFIIANKNGDSNIDTYGAYIVDLESKYIVGAKREQC